MEFSEQSSQINNLKPISEKAYLFLSLLVIFWCLTFPVNGAIFQLTSYLIPLSIFFIAETRVEAVRALKSDGLILLSCLVLPLLISGLKEFFENGHIDAHEIFVFFWRLVVFPIALSSIANTRCFNQRKFGRIFTFILVLYAFTGIIQYFSGHVLYKGSGYDERMYAIVGNPNPFGLLMAFGVVLALAQRSLWGSLNTIILTFFSIALMALCAFLSGSRGAWLALAIGGGVVLVFRYREIPIKSYIIVVLILVAIILTISQFHSVSKYLQVRLSHIDHDAPRMHLWPHYLHLFLEQPVFGHGTVSMRFDYGGERIHGPHNIYIEVLFRTGVVGFSLFSLALLYIFKKLWLTAETRPYISLLSILLVGGFFDYSIYEAEFFQSLFALLIATAISRTRNSSENSTVASVR